AWSGLLVRAALKKTVMHLSSSVSERVVVCLMFGFRHYRRHGQYSAQLNSVPPHQPKQKIQDVGHAMSTSILGACSQVHVPRCAAWSLYVEPMADKFDILRPVRPAALDHGREGPHSGPNAGQRD